MTAADPHQKRDVREFWQEASCGEVYAKGVDVGARFEAHRRARYELEPYIADFADFGSAVGRDVLELGVGMGADHFEWARHGPRSLTGVDLTPRAVDWTAERLRLGGFSSALAVADAECLPFPDSSFDLVYSWGVLHHTPDTPSAIDEVHRVLRPGGDARLMIYHSKSIVGYLLWLRYALVGCRPWRSLTDIYSAHLESPGTKAYTIPEAREMTASFRRASISVQLSFGDLLQGEVGQRHRSPLLDGAKKLWPRRFIRATMSRHGLLLLIRASK